LEVDNSVEYLISLVIRPILWLWTT